MFIFKNCKHTNAPSLRRSIMQFAKKHGVKGVTFNGKAKKVLGTYNSGTKQLFLSLTQTKKQMLCTFFHELAHHTAVKQRKWLSYHFNTKDFSAIDSYNIENKIDRIAQKLWNKFVNKKTWGKYIYAYPLKRRPKCQT